MTNTDRKKLIRRLSDVFTRLHYKINFDINNTSSYLLATDLLRKSSKHNLFRIVTINIEHLFLDLIKNKKELTSNQCQLIFFSLIRQNTQEFLTDCYGVDINITYKVVKDSFYTKYLLLDERIFLGVPIQLLSTDTPTVFQSIFVPIYSKPFDSFVEALLDNLVVELTNAVMFIIINEFSFIYEVRKKIYRSNFLSLRTIERFRNNLSWQSWTKNFVTRPSDIYNSQQGIWVIRTTGISYRIIYANRSNELVALRHLPVFTIIIIEAKDFVLSRLDEIIYFFGSGVRYFFTSVLGQLIGLIWRGVIEGLKK